MELVIYVDFDNLQSAQQNMYFSGLLFPTPISRYVLNVPLDRATVTEGQDTVLVAPVDIPPPPPEEPKA